jgi:hypothetical protein
MKLNFHKYSNHNMQSPLESITSICSMVDTNYQRNSEIVFHIETKSYGASVFGNMLVF